MASGAIIRIWWDIIKRPYLDIDDIKFDWMKNISSRNVSSWKNLLLVLEKDVVSTSSKGFVHQERRQGKEKHRRLLQKNVLVRRRKLCGLNNFLIFNFGNQISSQTTLELKCDQTWRCGIFSNLPISFGGVKWSHSSF